ncbi:hypothetical protein KY290_007689 [Solanum tuberosum]|uniref:Uncharacterized protein n=1 Tax=Solanum tuberosum TaxID=4113 RepID=A0ABQ7W879_SOLTU|nr:hypothetical protein KY290_007689 [Solanum tuberosum]
MHTICSLVWIFSTSNLHWTPFREQAAEDVVMQRQKFLQLLKDNLNTTQARMKYFVDNRRTEREFAVGDQVYLKLQPYRQSSLELRRNFKLNSKYYGPYHCQNRCCGLSVSFAS